MAPITWKNIGAPSFVDVVAEERNANVSNQAGLNNIQTILTEHQNINNQNFDIGKDQNTAEMIAKQKLTENLGEFNANKEQFARAALKDQFGAQVDVTKVEAARGAVQNRLRTEATDAALLTANQVADETKSPEAAAKAMRAQLVATGMSTAEADKRSQEYMENGLRLQDSATSRKNAATLFGQQQHDRAVEKNVYRGLSNAVGVFRETGDEAAAQKSIDNIKNTEERMKVQAQFNVQKERMGQFNEEDLGKLSYVDKSLAQIYDRKLQPARALVASKELELEKYQPGITDEEWTTMKKDAPKAGGMLQTLKESTGDDGLWGWKTWGSGFVNDQEFQETIVPAVDALVKGGIKRDTAERLALDTARQMAGTGEAWTGSDAFNKIDYLARFNKNAQRELTREKKAAELVKLQKVVQNNTNVVAQQKLAKSQEATRAVRQGRIKQTGFDQKAFIELADTQGATQLQDLPEFTDDATSIDAAVLKIQNTLKDISGKAEKKAKKDTSSWTRFQDITNR